MWRPGKRHLPASLQKCVHAPHASAVHDACCLQRHALCYALTRALAPHRSGPTLPSRLLREIGGDADGLGGGGGGRSGPPRPAGSASGAAARKARRKAERQEKAQRVRCGVVTRSALAPAANQALTAAAARCAVPPRAQRAMHAAPRPRVSADGGGAAATQPGPPSGARSAVPAAAGGAKRVRESDDGAPPRKRPAPAAPERARVAEAAPKDKKKAKAGKAPPPLTAQQLRQRQEIEAELRLQRQLFKKLKGRTVRVATLHYRGVCALLTRVIGAARRKGRTTA
jgi:hypothetical protein